VSNREPAETFKKIVRGARTPRCAGGAGFRVPAAVYRVGGGARLPLMVSRRIEVEAGGLISYLADTFEVYRRTAVYVDRILKGAKRATFRSNNRPSFELAINLKTAKALGDDSSDSDPASRPGIE